KNVLGFQTHRDRIAIAYDKETLKKQITEYKGQLDKHEWMQYAHKVAYRPFDTRWGYLHTSVTDRPRTELKQNVVGRENLSLLSSRQQANTGYRHCWVVKYSANDCVI